MIDHFYAVIMAGGGGTRLWPLSRKKAPKQMLKIHGEKSLFKLAVQRLEGLFSPDRIFVVTVQNQARLLQKECPIIPRKNYLIEPSPRGTASVVGLAAIHLKTIDHKAVMAILTADQIIGNIKLFHSLLVAGYEAANLDYLVTLGIEPTYPATGYGYIHAGNNIAERLSMPALIVKRFVEKPDKTKALRFLKSNEYYWNSGMFIWKAERIIEEFESQMGKFAKTLHTLSSAVKLPRYHMILKNEWEKINPQTIDYGIMEGAKRVVVLPAKNLGWSDVGSWDSLFDFLIPDKNGNVTLAKKNILLDVRNSLFHTISSDKLVVAVDIENLVVIDTNDALLICRRDQTQRVKEIVACIKQNWGDQYL
jgi:mannose-1-phosphate guanylyltransferase